MKSIFEQVIKRGNYDLTGLLKNIDRYHVEGKVTDDERDALYALARKDAVPQYDVADEINRLWAAVRELSDNVAQLMAGNGEETIPPEEEPADEWPEFVQPQGAHDAYRIGDRVTYNGQHYVCKLDGTVWSPSVYPAAWDEADGEDA